MDILEEVTETVHRGFFVDLFVRVSNAAAIAMYHKVAPGPTAQPLPCYCMHKFCSDSCGISWMAF